MMKKFAALLLLLAFVLGTLPGIASAESTVTRSPALLRQMPP